MFVRHHQRGNRLTLVPRCAHGLEPQQRRGAFSVIVADMDAEAQQAGGAVAPADRKAEHREHVPQAARLVLAGDAGRDRDALSPGGDPARSVG